MDGRELTIRLYRTRIEWKEDLEGDRWGMGHGGWSNIVYQEGRHNGQPVFR